MNLSISKLFLAVAKGAILNRPTNIDKSAIQEWEEKISDTEKKIKLSDLERKESSFITASSAHLTSPASFTDRPISSTRARVLPSNTYLTQFNPQNKKEQANLLKTTQYLTQK